MSEERKKPDTKKTIAKRRLIKCSTGVFLVNTKDKEIARLIGEKKRGPEWDTLDHAIAIIKSKVKGWKPEQGSFVDVGANIGSTTVYALLHHRFKRAIAFEPEPRNYRLLLRNLFINGVSNGRAIALPYAISDVPENLLLELSPTNFGDHRLRLCSINEATKKNHAYREDLRKTIQVGTVALDSLLDRYKVAPVSLLWIDAQGAEGHILAGASQLVKENPVPTVIEFWPYGLKRSKGVKLLKTATSFRWFFDLKEPKDEPLEFPKRLDLMYAKYDGTTHTDLLLLP